MMSANTLASRAAAAAFAPAAGARRAVSGTPVASTLGRSNNRRVVVNAALVCAAAAPGDDEYKSKLSRALRTVDFSTVASKKPPASAAPAADAAAPAIVSAAAAAMEDAEKPTPSAASSDDGIQYTLQGPEPQKFGVAEGELANVLTASGSFVTRAVSGALCEGWTPSIVEVGHEFRSHTPPSK